MGFLAFIPFFVLTLYLLASMRSYSRSYDNIVSNMTTANNYNLNFKDEMDESLYRMVARNITVEELEEERDVRSPYTIIEELRSDCQELRKITTDEESRQWLIIIIRNVDTLKNRVDDICENIEAGGRYDKNILMLDNNIYILTELIQEDIQKYIYYQTQSIETLKTQLNSQVDKFIMLYIILIAAVAIVVIAVTLIITNSIIRPLNKLVEVTGLISQGDFSVRSHVDTRDEIAMLSESVNEMTEHLETMVTTIKDDERRMRHTELRLLQEQINPHFLYNTLDTIVWLIESNKAEEAENMVISLSSFFRLVLSHGKEFITIAEEEKHIRSYLEIQQVRYKDILDYDIRIDPIIYPYEILKLTLQPIVENALYHGIKYKRAKGTIRVTGSREGNLIRLVVSDDGVGMDEAELLSLREQIMLPCGETDKGFGLANVNERIRMNFGQEYGMDIESAQGVGTKVTILIPVRERGAGDENEK